MRFLKRFHEKFKIWTFGDADFAVLREEGVVVLDNCATTGATLYKFRYLGMIT